MYAVYEGDNYIGRVNFAASYIAAGRNCTRCFDTCFEMYDGVVVAVALGRRALNNPNGKLAKNFFRYIDEEMTKKNLADYAHVPTKHLALEAAKIRKQREDDNAAYWAKRKEEEKE